jgi:hypothetical protein
VPFLRSGEHQILRKVNANLVGLALLPSAVPSRTALM